MHIFFIILTSIFLSLGCSKSQESRFEKKADFSEQPQKTVVRKDTTITFENVEAGKMPPGWLNHFTGKGKLGKWEVRLDDGNKVLAQVSAENFGYHFNVAVWKESNYRDLELTVKFKSVESK